MCKKTLWSNHNVDMQCWHCNVQTKKEKCSSMWSMILTSACPAIPQVTNLDACWAILLEVVTMFWAFHNWTHKHNLWVIQRPLQSSLLCNFMSPLCNHELIVCTISAMGISVLTMFGAGMVSHNIIIFIEHDPHASWVCEVRRWKNGLLLDWLKSLEIWQWPPEHLLVLEALVDLLLETAAAAAAAAAWTAAAGRKLTYFLLFQW